MNRSLRIAGAVLLSCCIDSDVLAQNSSLLHAPTVGRMVQLPGGSNTRTAWPGPQASTQLALRDVGQAIQDQRDQRGQVEQTPYDDRPAVPLNSASWTFQPAPPLRVFRLNDVVTIRVDEITRMMAEGAAESRKRTLYEAILTDWIRLQDFRLRPDPQGNGDPAVSAESNSNYRADSSIESRESLTFNIAATVVDIRPNGNLLLEARKAIRVNDNLWETSLSGMCRTQDIAADNVVLSKDLIDLEIKKEDQGHLRDGYKRGWLQRLVDRFKPF
jgi:flagellar L-ring protein precursor FlgH